VLFCVFRISFSSLLCIAMFAWRLDGVLCLLFQTELSMKMAESNTSMATKVVLAIVTVIYSVMLNFSM
jgi:hypothetical protein